MTHKKYTEEYFQSKSKDELVKMLTEHLNCKKYGLVWEDTPEKIDSKNIYPLLKHSKELSLDLIQDKPMNYLIEGDNYHSLKALQKTHLGKIDVIYIDPPYNTGNEFVYNDKIVDKEDNFRHSKWLSFMEKRLSLAKNLLSEDGVIFVSIDDNEQAQLKLLMDEIFGGRNFICNVSVVNNLSGRSDSKGYAQSHEYKLAYTKNISEFNLGGFPMGEEYKKEYKYKDTISKYKKVGLKKTGKNSLRSDRPNMFYPIYFNLNTNEISLIRQSDSDIEIFPYIRGQEGRWRWGRETFLKRKDSEIVIDKNRNNEYTVYVKMRDLIDGKPREMKPKSIWLNPNYDTGNGTKLLKDILGNLQTFDSPKPIQYLKDIFTISTKKDSIILDFFAGSGTTGHAVMELNKEDGGNRSFILCTNNEVSDEKERTYLFEQGLIPKNNKTEFNRFKKSNPEEYQNFLNSKDYQELGISRSVTRERLKRVIEGYTTPKGVEVEGLPNNLMYLKTDEIDKESLLLDSTLPLAVKDTLNLVYPPTTHKIHLIDILTSIDKLNLDKEKENVFIIDSKDEETISMLSNKLLKVFGRGTLVEIMSKYI